MTRTFNILARLGKGLLAAVVIGVTTSCELFSDPAAPADLPLALSLQFAGSAQQQQFDNVDRISVRILDGNQTVLNTNLPFAVGGTDPHLRIRMDALFVRRALILDVVLLDADVPLYGGRATFTVDPDDVTVVEVRVFPIFSGITLANPVATIGALGAQVQLNGATVLANGDTVPGAVLTWVSLDTRFVTVTTGGLATAVAEGQARVRANSGNISAEGMVVVRQVVDTVLVTPPSSVVGIGATTSFGVTARDARGNIIAGRAFTWSSSDSTIARVNAAAGTVVGVRTGTVTVTATLEGKQGRAQLAVQSISTPTPPSNLAATGGQTSISLSWLDNATTEDEYQIWRKVGTSPSAQSTMRARLAPGATAYTDSTNTPDEQFEYTVRACNAAGCSAFSNAIVIRTVPRPPTNLTLTVANPNLRTVNLSWQDASVHETGFMIERRVGTGTFSQVAQASANVTQLQVTGVPGVNTYRTRACNGAGCSAPSNEVNATHAQPPPLVTTLSAPYSTELVGNVDGQGAPYTTWFEWASNPTLSGATITPTQQGTQKQDWTVPLQNLTPDLPIYYRIVASNAGGRAQGSIEQFLTPAPITGLFPDSVVCNSSPAGSGVCPFNAPSTAMSVFMEGPLGFPQPFSRAYAEVVSSGGARYPAGTAVITMTEATGLRTWTYTVTFGPPNSVLPAGFYTLELFGETPSGGSVRIFGIPISLTID